MRVAAPFTGRANLHAERADVVDVALDDRLGQAVEHLGVGDGELMGPGAGIGRHRVGILEFVARFLRLVPETA